MPEWIYPVLGVAGSFLLSVVVGLVVLWVVARHRRRRSRELVQLAQALGLRWLTSSNFIDPADEQHAMAEPGDPHASMQGTFQGYTVGIFPPGADHPVRVRLRSRFAGIVATYAPRHKPEGWVWLDTGDPDFDHGMRTRYVAPHLVSKMHELGLVDFYRRWRPRLIRFELMADELGCSFERGGSDARSGHRFLEPQDVRDVLPELVALAHRIEAASASAHY